MAGCASDLVNDSQGSMEKALGRRQNKDVPVEAG